MPNPEILASFAVFGLVFGSFANVLILRDARRKSILTDRSACPHCKHVLSWYELFPVLSWVFQGGKCRSCKKPISIQYPLVELLSALLAVLAVYLIPGNLLQAAFLFASLLLMLVVSVIDLKTQMVPVEYVVASGLFGLASQVGEKPLMGLLVGAGLLLAITYGWKAAFKQEGMGEGDSWIAGALGLIAGYPLIVPALVVAVFTGAFGGVAALLLTKQNLEAKIPFGPFLFLGLLVSLLWGDALLTWYTSFSGISF
jgi:leader peptidase (prepilin peptidase)/N-methyltransferase